MSMCSTLLSLPKPKSQFKINQLHNLTKPRLRFGSVYVQRGVIFEETLWFGLNEYSVRLLKFFKVFKSGICGFVPSLAHQE